MGGGGGEAQEGIWVYIWPTHVIVQQKLMQHGKAIISQ